MNNQTTSTPVVRMDSATHADSVARKIRQSSTFGQKHAMNQKEKVSEINERAQAKAMLQTQRLAKANEIAQVRFQEGLNREGNISFPEFNLQGERRDTARENESKKNVRLGPGYNVPEYNFKEYSFMTNSDAPNYEAREYTSMYD